MINLKINNKEYNLDDIDPETPLLWALRDTLGLVGTKFGCGVAQCGACTILLNGQPGRGCQMPVGALEGIEITTVEGLAEEDGTLSALQQAWIDHDVPQCGYCQAGQLLAATSLLERNPSPSTEEIDTAMSGNICRCGTYTRIVSAIQSVAKDTGGAA
jgi:aerobic-type carbon monoxide dehydrogenase small subunit (CoxS/CutS family)